MATHITTLAGLQAMKNNLAEDYILDNDIDATATSGWNAGAGFVSVGDNANPFTGSFDGQNFTISNLYINKPATDYIGLFGYVDTIKQIKDVGIEDCDITGNGYIGGLIGDNHNVASIISNCHTTGQISSSGAYDIGGLCGGNYGTISNCYSTVTLSVRSDTLDVGWIGGLIGYNKGDISRCYATGDITSGSVIDDVSYVGGLIGDMDAGDVSQSYATGNINIASVDGDYIVHIGGLIGGLGTPFAGGDCNISESYATGNITTGNALGTLAPVGGIRWIGGLLGYVYKNSTVANSYAKGNIVTGNTDAEIKYIGGLIGQNNCAVSECYSIGSITTGTAGQGTTYVGGLVGRNYAATGTVVNSFWDIQASGLATSNGGTGKATIHMKTEATFTGAGWNFAATWTM